MQPVTAPGRLSHRAAWVLRWLVGPLVQLCFRPTLDGTEHLPADRPYLLVANHSAGVGAAELASIATLWFKRFGTTRPLAGFALPLGFVVWPVSAVHRALGTIPSTYPSAHDALAKGVPLLVFPGGDHESLKPVWHNHGVDFAGRVGFLRIAREAGVPIVPLGIRNGALTAPILLRSRFLPNFLILPRLLGLKRWGLSLLGVSVAALLAITLPFGALPTALLIWIWLSSPFVFLPIFPATLRLRIGPPLTSEALFPSNAGEEELAEARDRVERAIEALVRG